MRSKNLLPKPKTECATTRKPSVRVLKPRAEFRIPSLRQLTPSHSIRLLPSLGPFLGEIFEKKLCTIVIGDFFLFSMNDAKDIRDVIENPRVTLDLVVRVLGEVSQVKSRHLLENVTETFEVQN